MRVRKLQIALIDCNVTESGITDSYHRNHMETHFLLLPTFGKLCNTVFVHGAPHNRILKVNRIQKLHFLIIYSSYPIFYKSIFIKYTLGIHLYTQNFTHEEISFRIILTFKEIVRLVDIYVYIYINGNFTKSVMLFYLEYL